MARFIMASSSGMRPCMAIMYCSGSGRELNERKRERESWGRGGRGVEEERRGEERRGEERRGEERRGEERREERRGEERGKKWVVECSVTQ